MPGNPTKLGPVLRQEIANAEKNAIVDHIDTMVNRYLGNSDFPGGKFLINRLPREVSAANFLERNFRVFGKHCEISVTVSTAAESTPMAESVPYTVSYGLREEIESTTSSVVTLALA